MPKAEVSGIKLHYDLTGSGVPLICIHPPLLTGEIFAYQRGGLSDVCRLITFDIRGHGRSEPSSEVLSYTLIADDIIGLMDYLGLSHAYLCGYSTGGGVAVEAMLRHPDRFLGSILISSTTEMDDKYNKSRLWAATALSKLRITKLLSAAVTWGNADSGPTFHQLYRHAVAGNARQMHQYFEASYRYRVIHRLREIRQPALLVYGQKDRSFHPYAQILHRGLADSELYFIPGAKHQIPTKSSRELHKLVHSWLGSHERLIAAGDPETTRKQEQSALSVPVWVEKSAEQVEQQDHQ